MIGKTLGHYQITSQLGKGGMGEVFQAKDQKLGRDVAIKVLPEEFAKDADRVARFQREAKVLASLNHSNIAAIYGLEESGGTSFLVLELVEGQTLSDRLKTGPIPVEEALNLALQIAEALVGAHEKGVIHRDLKPANIKVTPDDKVKVLDFGLAKAYAGELEQMNLSNSPTLSDAATMQGVILGTAAYMSPEQARGKPVDKRADIWAFGCVLFEMLTGQAAFQGEDVTEILAAVVKSEANLDLLPTNIHPRIREAITRCLQKDLKKRYSSITDARYEIEQVLADPGGVLVHPVTAGKARRRIRLALPWVAAVAVAAAIIAGVSAWNLKPLELRQVMRFYYDLPKDQQFNAINLKALAVSKDGRQFVYNTPGGFYLRSLDQSDAKLIGGSEANPVNPFFSPDGKWIGYWSMSDSKLKKISINGGAPVVLCDSDALLDANWDTDDTIVYGESGKGIMRISPNGGTPELLVKLTGMYLVGPQILPDGKTLLFTRKEPEGDQVIVKSLKSGEQKVLLKGEAVRYLPTGHIVFLVRNALFSVPFDLDKLVVAGSPVPLGESVFRSGGNAPQVDISNAGTLVYIPGAAAAAGRTPMWVDREGKEEPLAAPPDIYVAPRISPDGTRLAFTAGTGENADIYIWDLVHGNRTRLTSEKGEDSQALWSPDGKWIVFASHREGSWDVYRKAANGTGTAEKLGSVSGDYLRSLSWSADGKTLVFESGSAERNNITALAIERDRALKPLLEDEFITANPCVSPDGKWLAYMSGESDQDEIYVRTFPDVNGGKWLISTNGGQEPRWSSDSRELFYRGDGAMMVVSVEAGSTFKFGAPRKLFRDVYFSEWGHNWDISPDGKRFLMINLPGETTSGTGPGRINIVVNWLEELKQRMPAK